MRRLYVLIPLVAMVAFFSYYAHWNAAAALRPLPHERSGDRYFGRDGAREAGAALARGKLVYLEYGLAVPWEAERREVARKQFGIECRSIAGCVITDSLQKFATAYNAVMEAAIVSRFGPHVFDVVNREGQALLEARWAKNG